jgi:hypothetical protein
MRNKATVDHCILCQVSAPGFEAFLLLLHVCSGLAVAQLQLINCHDRAGCRRGSGSSASY